MIQSVNMIHLNVKLSNSHHLGLPKSIKNVGNNFPKVYYILALNQQSQHLSVHPYFEIHYTQIFIFKHLSTSTAIDGTTF